MQPLRAARCPGERESVFQAHSRYLETMGLKCSERALLPIRTVTAMASTRRETGYLGGCGIPGTGSLWEEPASISSDSSAGLGARRVLLGISAGLFLLTRNIFGLGVFSGVDVTKALNSWTALVLVVRCFSGNWVSGLPAGRRVRTSPVEAHHIC